MKNKQSIYTFVVITIAVIIILACRTILPTATITPPEPTNTTAPPSPTFTVIPPTNTPTPAGVTINADNIQGISVRYEFDIPEDSIRTLAFSPDGKMLVAGSGMNTSSPDQKVRLWNVETGDLLAETEKLHTIVWDIAYSPSGDKIAVALDNATIQLRNSEDLSILDRIEQLGAVNSVSFSPDGNRLAAGVADADGDGGVVYIWDLGNRELVLEFWAHAYSVSSIDFSPGGSLIATGAVDRSVKVWNSQTGILLQTLPQEGQGSTVKFSPDGLLLATGVCSQSTNYVCEKGSVLLWDTMNWQVSKVLIGPNEWVEEVDFSPSQEMIAGASRDGFIYVWRLSDGVLVHALSARSPGVDAVSFSSDGNYIASGSYGSVKIWSIDR